MEPLGKHYYYYYYSHSINLYAFLYLQEPLQWQELRNTAVKTIFKTNVLCLYWHLLIWTLIVCVLLLKDRMIKKDLWLLQYLKERVVFKCCIISFVRLLFYIESYNSCNIIVNNTIDPRNVTEFTYRLHSETYVHSVLVILCVSWYYTLHYRDKKAHICMSIQTNTVDEFKDIVNTISTTEGMSAMDLTDNEMAKSHLRHLVGGRSNGVYNLF